MHPNFFVWVLLCYCIPVNKMRTLKKSDANNAIIIIIVLFCIYLIYFKTFFFSYFIPVNKKCHTNKVITISIIIIRLSFKWSQMRETAPPLCYNGWLMEVCVVTKGIAVEPIMSVRWRRQVKVLEDAVRHSGVKLWAVTPGRRNSQVIYEE